MPAADREGPGTLARVPRAIRWLSAAPHCPSAATLRREPCPKLLARVFKGQTTSAAQIAEDEQKATEEIEVEINNGEVLWDGRQWLVDPQ